MELEHLLKKLKNIEPREDYSSRSRAHLLANLPARKIGWSLREVVLNIFESGSAMAMTALLLVVLAGGISIVKFLPQVALNRDSIKAEAQAIDIQIKLADVNYKELGNKLSNNSSVAAKPKVSPSTAGTGEGSAVAGTGKASDSTTTPDMSVDEALNALSSM